jgi:hypothetical protein
MTSLQKVVLGTPPTAVDGDTVRVANTKANANVDVLNTQAALTSATGITTAQALTAAHLGKRINIALATAGVINLPSASTCPADSVLLLRNTGTTVVTLAITAGSGDTVALSKLNPGETVVMDSDGAHAWNVLMRGRTNSDNEVVNGNCTVNGNETVGGALGVSGNATLGGTLTTAGLSTHTVGASFGASGQAAISAAGAYSGASAAYTGNVTIGGTLGVTGQATFTLRPTFASNTPWDSGNLVSPARQTVGNTFTAVNQFVGSAYTFTTSPLFVNVSGSQTVMGIGFGNASGNGVWRLNANTFEAANGTNTGLTDIRCTVVTQTSDAALKTDVAEFGGVLDLLKGKRVVRYRLKRPASEGGGASDVHVGVIAQEWRDDFPELVQEANIDIDEEGDFIAHQYDGDGNEVFGPGGKPASRKLLTFNYANASAVAIAAVMELKAALSEALERIAALEGKA